MSGYSFGKLTESKALTRIVFLETVAGVPGSVASTLRHLASLRRMKRDGGWINSLMSEAENERMHVSHTKNCCSRGVSESEGPEPSRQHGGSPSTWVPSQFEPTSFFFRRLTIFVDCVFFLISFSC